MLRLKVPKKNMYAIGPEIVGENGKVEFSRAGIASEIKLYQKTSPMDYVCNLEEVTALEVSVMSSEAIRALIDARKVWGEGVEEWRLDSDLIRQLRASRAHEWKPSKTELDVNKIPGEPHDLQIDLVAFPVTEMNK